MPTSPRLDRPVVDFVRRDYIALRAWQTVGDALATLRGQTLSEQVLYLYVLDEAHRLVGVVPMRRLLVSAPETPLDTLMQTQLVTLPDTASLLTACEFFVMYRLLAFPVVTDDGRLLGSVDVKLFADEILDLSERQAADDVFQLIGVRMAAARAPGPWEGFRARFPWLLCNVAGGLACAFIVGRNEVFLDSFLILALFIPIVLALAESVSMQAMTLALQAMHERRVDWSYVRRSLRRELLTALLLGGATGTLVGLAALVWSPGVSVALAIGVAILLAVVTACTLGVLLPGLVRVLRGDPRIAAGPVVLAAADMATLVLYFQVAGWLLR